MQRTRATFAYVFSLVIYGTIGWPLAFTNLPSEVVVLCRGILGTLSLLLVIAITRGRFDFQAVRENLGWLALSGICLGLNWVFLFAAYRTISVAVASLCNYMAPVLLIIVAPLILGEPRSKKKLVCAGVAVLGMVLVSGVLEGGAQVVNPQGLLLAAAAALGFAGMVLCNKKMGAMPLYEKASVQLMFTIVATLPFVLVNNWGEPLSPDALSVGLVVLMGLVHTGFAYCLYFGALETLSAQTVAVLGYVEPAVAVLVSTLILHQPLSALGWLGAVLILGAAAASEVVE